jgi:hypothetical protein
MPLISSKRRKAVIEYVWSVAKGEFKNLLHIMQTSKGRDKIFGLTLYIVDLYIKCRKYAFKSSPFITALNDPQLQMLIERYGGKPPTIRLSSY